MGGPIARGHRPRLPRRPVQSRGQRRHPRHRRCRSRRRRRRLGVRAGDPIAVARAEGAAAAPAYSSYFLYAVVSASSTGPSISADLK